MIFRTVGVIVGTVAEILRRVWALLRTVWQNMGILVRLLFYGMIGLFGLGLSSRVVRSLYAVTWPQWGIHVFIFLCMTVVHLLIRSRHRPFAQG